MKEDGKPPSPVYDMAHYNNFVMCSPIPPVYVYRFLLWLPTEKKGIDSTRIADRANDA